MQGQYWPSRSYPARSWPDRYWPTGISVIGHGNRKLYELDTRLSDIFSVHPAGQLPERETGNLDIRSSLTPTERLVQAVSTRANYLVGTARTCNIPARVNGQAGTRASAQVNDRDTYPVNSRTNAEVDD